MANLSGFISKISSKTWKNLRNLSIGLIFLFPPIVFVTPPIVRAMNSENTWVGLIIPLAYVIPIVISMLIHNQLKKARIRDLFEIEQQKVIAADAARNQQEAFRKTAPGRVDSALTTLDSYTAQYEGYDIYPKIVGVSKDMRALLERLADRGTPQQLLIAQTQYADILEKTVMCVSPKYLKDIIDNPTYWHHPEKRLAEVEAVLDAVPEQIVQNIRQVNSSSDLDFQTALAVLGNISDDAEIAALYEMRSR